MVYFVACIVAVMGMLKASAYVIGIYTKFDMSLVQIQGMQAFFREYEKNFDTMDEKTRREHEKKRLFYEIKLLNAAEPFVRALEDANQIGS